MIKKITKNRKTSLALLVVAIIATSLFVINQTNAFPKIESSTNLIGNSVKITYVNPVPPGPPPATASNIVPNYASTIAGTEHGTTFSLKGSGFSASTSVTIGGVACAIISQSATGLACNMPTTGLSSGVKQVAVDGTDVPNTTVKFDDTNYPTLQSLTTATCSTTPSIYRDERDSAFYYVAKLADNKCWMLDNLHYQPAGSANTDLKWTGFLTADGTSAGDTNYDSLKYVDPIATDYCTGTTGINEKNITKCGFLYNFFAATAGTAPTTQASGNASGSICPTNWHLPSGTSGGEYYILADAMGATGGYAGSLNFQSTGPFQGVYSGSYDSGFYNQGSHGYYWSSSIYGGARGAYNLSFNSSDINYATRTDSRFYGFAVRCAL